MEKEFILDASDGAKIYGVLNYIKGNKGVIVVAHGLTGHKNEHHFFNAVKFFSQKGFDVVRFDFYNGEKGGKSLTTCSIEDHIEDLKSVVEYFSKNYDKIFLVGHSLGGLVILRSNLEELGVNGISLWDPTLKWDLDKDDEIKFEEKLNLYIQSWGVEYLMNKKYHDEIMEFSNYDGVLDKIDVPTQIICAGKGVLWKKWKKEINKIKNNDFVIIKGASHVFDEEGKEEELFKETLRWFEKN